MTPNKKTLSEARQASLANRKNATRATILAAARAAFAESSYVQAKIDDIILGADVSRSTFYAHFESKRELAYAIYDEVIPKTRALFARLPAALAEGLDGVTAWLRSFVDQYVEHRGVSPLLAQLQLFEATFRERIRRDTEELIARLPVFAEARTGEEIAADRDLLRRWIKARLIVNQASAVCAQIARGDLSPAESELSLEWIAHEMIAFFGNPGKSP